MHPNERLLPRPDAQDLVQPSTPDCQLTAFCPALRLESKQHSRLLCYSVLEFSGHPNRLRHSQHAALMMSAMSMDQLWRTSTRHHAPRRYKAYMRLLSTLMELECIAAPRRLLLGLLGRKWRRKAQEAVGKSHSQVMSEVSEVESRHSAVAFLVGGSTKPESRTELATFSGQKCRTCLLLTTRLKHGLHISRTLAASLS